MASLNICPAEAQVNDFFRAPGGFANRLIYLLTAGHQRYIRIHSGQGTVSYGRDFETRFPQPPLFLCPIFPWSLVRAFHAQ